MRNPSKHERSDAELEEMLRRALEVRRSTRLTGAARQRIAARLGIEARRPLRWAWLAGAVAVAAVLIIAIIGSELGPPPVARETTPTSQPVDPPSSATPPASEVTGFGLLPKPEFVRTTGDIDPAALRFRVAPGTQLPGEGETLVGRVEFDELTVTEAQTIADTLGFSGMPTEARYGRTTSWTWREDARSVSVEDDGSIEYDDPVGSGRALDLSDPAGAARGWLEEVFGADPSRLARDPLLREIGDGRVQVNFNPPAGEIRDSLDYYLEPGSGAFPYATVTLLPAGTIQQASYRDATVAATSLYPRRSGTEVLELLQSGTYPVRIEDAEDPRSLTGVATIQEVRIGYQLVPDESGVAYLVPVFRVTGTLVPDAGSDARLTWTASLPAIAAGWIDGD